MRCPKCGYISFDHVETCIKCKKDISGKVGFNGTTYHVAAPAFLKFAQDDMSEDDSEFEESGFEQDGDDSEYTDPDLEVLAGDGGGFAPEEDDVDENITFDNFESDDVAAEFQIEGEDDFELEAGAEDDDGFEFELEDDNQGEDQLSTADFNVPDELSDISDLKPPVAGRSKAPAGRGDVNLSLDDDTNVTEDSNLDGMDFNLGLGNDEGDLSLSLDDIDISGDELAGSGNDDVDSLSMDLDLGGLDDEPSSKTGKSKGGLDDFNFSLD